HGRVAQAARRARRRPRLRTVGNQQLSAGVGGTDIDWRRALADAYGKARMLSIGCLLFGVASAGCAVAPSLGWLIGARVLQGIAAGLLPPASLALIGATYPKDERAGAIGVWAAASALTSAAGPVFGGWLTDSFGWQAIFWINPPLAVVTIALLWLSAPPD